ncbi:tetratricopeptide repeat protein [Chitinophaga pinensis]|uniref:Tetratricopeptide TPR_2 repeat protein n=1 Tax=Chitinophaga pinensis (strain ATCC 43595 / DSM 2588 / LMG 13176 / NBRC 15968 / NCIMB 11800 / UQM 2034) TaxID=485918 RepID=A0A979GBW9_CHIPD|nr:tetratricopeptide repeat protein [Chitinophaga pinensis]ACU64153.1 Tetratricopeptide TPR_2 repeat protein [Chitinophaga pinensis DSM 2588]
MKYLKHLVITGILLCTVLTSYSSSRSYCDSLIQRGIDSMMAKKFVSAITLLTEAQHQSADNHLPRQLFLATNNIGLTYYFMLDYGEALRNYLEAYKIAMEEKDATLEMTVLNNIAILYSKEKNYDKAREYFLKAYTIAKEKNDKIRIGNYALNLGIVHTEIRQLEKAREYLRESASYLQNDPRRLISARYAYAQNQFQEEHTTEADLLSLELLKVARDSGYRDERISLLTLISSIKLKQNNSTLALQYANEALSLSPNLEERIELFQTLSAIHLKDHAYAQAMASKDSVVYYRDSINTVKNGQQFETGKLKFELLNSQHTLSLNNAQLSNQRRLLYIALAFIAIIVTFFIWLMRIKAAENKQKAILAERSHQIMALEIENEKSQKLLLEEQLKEKETAALLEQERLKNEIEIRNRKLSAKALYLSGRNELIDDIITAMSKIPDLNKDGVVVKHISQLKSYLRTDSEWDDFSTHFQEVNQGFLNALRENHPNLTSNDVRFLSYIYMNLNTKEIASLLNITPEGCRKRKERITKKMQLAENTSLFEYLSGL